MELVKIDREPDEEITFDTFWLLWPKERRMSRAETVIEWYRINPTEHAGIITALAGWRKVWYARREWQYVMHPHRWLKKRRWEDELPPEFATREPTPIPPRGDVPKSIMPEHVRALIAKLRSK